jgi:hypothetical protein
LPGARWVGQGRALVLGKVIEVVSEGTIAVGTKKPAVGGVDHANILAPIEVAVPPEDGRHAGLPTIEDG